MLGVMAPGDSGRDGLGTTDGVWLWGGEVRGPCQ